MIIQSQLQKAESWSFEDLSSCIQQYTSYFISTNRKMLDEDKQWGIVDKETMARKYDFEGEIYMSNRQTEETHY